MRNVVVAGSTGLIGSEAVRLLGARGDVQVTALVRKPTGLRRPPNVTERVFDCLSAADLKRLGTAEILCDVLLCCVGTTMRQAGSEDAFRLVERDVPLALAARVAALGPSVAFGFVSSAGAGRPAGFYLRNKAETEAGIQALGVRGVIVRPSLLLGERQEFRLGERIAVLLLPPIAALLSALTLRKIGWIGRVKPIHAERVARSLIRLTVDEPPPNCVIVEGYAFG